MKRKQIRERRKKKKPRRKMKVKGRLIDWSIRSIIDYYTWFS
jgi:hypothetical protein